MEGDRPCLDVRDSLSLTSQDHVPITLPIESSFRLSHAPVVHRSAGIVVGGVECHLEYAEPGAEPCTQPGAKCGPELEGGGEFRFVPD